MGDKDYVKICHARDNKFTKDEQKRISSLIDNELFPRTFDFPLTLQFELTTHCNVRCKHCYNNSGVANTKKDRMGASEWKEFAKYLVKKGGIFQCVISGGEPLLMGDDLFEIMDILHNDGTSFLVISNCFLMTQEKAKRFSKYRYQWFQVSIDGATPEVHDEFRQRSGSWERAVKGAYMLSKEGIPLAIAHSVNPQNVSQIEDMCKLAYELGAGSILLGEVTPSGRSANNHELLLNYEQKNFLYRKAEELAQYYAGRMRVQRSSTVRNQLKRYMNTPNSGAIIRPNGDIRLDCMAPFVIGNVLDEDFQQIWLQKGGTCWENPEVIKYAESYNEDDDINVAYKNYFDEDIHI